jgi:FkbH-like protein
MDALSQYRSLRKEGRLVEALALIRTFIPTMDAGLIMQAGKMFTKDLPLAFPEDVPVQVLVLGQCTTSYLLPALTARAWAEGVHVSMRGGDYDQVVQELMQLKEAPDVIVLLPWHQRLLAADTRGTQDRIEDEMVFLQQAWAEVARLKAKLVQVSYDWIGTGALGFSLSSRRGGEVEWVRQTNASLRASLPPGASFIDLESISAWHGKARFYDERNYHWLKQPFSPEGLSALARHIAAGVRALTAGRRKVLLLDLDNTVWGGVVGELGPNAIAVGGTTEGEAFLAFQKFVKRLKQSGVLLAACSKNNDADAREPFEKNDQMALRLDDFAAFHASWDAKPARIRAIAAELNLGLDSFVFFDDNPAERAHVRAELPEVMVIEVPEEPALYIRALQESLAFEAVDLTAADAERATQYTAEASRKQKMATAASPEAYLASLGMTAVIQPIGSTNLDRVVDLITKTNQFNLTTRRHSRAAVEEMIATPRSVCFAVSLADKFGDYGLISVLLGVPLDDKTLRLDTWLMSCRAMGRTVEHRVMNHLAAAARGLGYDRLLGEYVPTPKSVPVQSLLQEFGFKPEQTGPGGSLYALRLQEFSDMPTQVL